MAAVQPILALPGFDAPIPLWIGRRKRQKFLARSVLLDYAKNTTLHGLRYISEKGLHVIEKVFWIITFLSCVSLSAWFIYDVWHKWQTSPIIVAFSERLVPVEEVPFPSIIICPELKCKASVYNYSKTFEWKENRTSEEIKFITDILMICLKRQDSSFWGDENVRTTDVSTVENIIAVSPTLEDIMFTYGCEWHGRPCKSFVSTVLTEEGVCFSFNSLAATEIFRTENIQQEYNYTNSPMMQKTWSPKRVYYHAISTKKYPFQGSSNNRMPNLKFRIIVPKAEYDGLCNFNQRGFKIYVQHPTSHAQATVNSFGLSPGEKMSLAIKADVSTTSNKLRKYSPEVYEKLY